MSSPNIIRKDAELAYSFLLPYLHVLNGTTMLITGASGFMCRHMVEVLGIFNEVYDPGCRVIAVDHGMLPMHPLPIRRNVQPFRHDVVEKWPLTEKIDWIIHGASIASPPQYRLHPLRTIDVNVQGTRNMLDLMRPSKGMLLLSSSEIYGDPDPEHIPTKEDYRGYVSCTGPRACYDESKRLGETLAMTYWRKFGTPVKIIRPFNVYGPGQRLDDGRIIPDLMSAALSQRPIILYGDGRATRSFCYIRDAVRAMFLILFQGQNGEAYNVGNDEEVSIHSVAQIAAGLGKTTVEMQTSTDPDYLTDTPLRRCPDLTKLKKLGWFPEVKVTQGLGRTFDSYSQAQGAAQ